MNASSDKMSRPGHDRREGLRSLSLSRSRSPYRDLDSQSARKRSRSPTRSSRNHHHRRHHHERKRKRALPRLEPAVLPFKAPKLSRSHLETYRPMFASYLDIQKQLDLYELTEEELKGRWKSFVGKWNRGELAEGWYDPQTKALALERAASEDIRPPPQRTAANLKEHDNSNDDQSSDENDDNYGPSLPTPSQQQRHPRASRANASRALAPPPPSFEDLALRDEAASAESASAHTALRSARKADRAEQKRNLDELVPRAEPGTRERQLEKKRENAADARAFREAREGGGAVEDVPEAELFGDAGGVEGFKARKNEEQRRKGEWEIKREEVLRARAAEREERLAVVREREERTMEMLRAIAQERFGSGSRGDGGSD